MKLDQQKEKMLKDASRRLFQHRLSKANKLEKPSKSRNNSLDLHTTFQMEEDAAVNRLRIDNTNEFQMKSHTKRYLHPTPMLISNHISNSNLQQSLNHQQALTKLLNK